MFPKIDTTKSGQSKKKAKITLRDQIFLCFDRHYHLGLLGFINIGQTRDWQGVTVLNVRCFPEKKTPRKKKGRYKNMIVNNY